MDSSPPSNESDKFPNTSRLGYCEICNSCNAKYVCPGCECRTCCLQCSKIHKKDFECNGERDKTKYVSLKNKNKNTNLILLSDYRLLEEITRKTEVFHKAAKPNNRLRHNLRKLGLAASARNIELKFFPPMFKRNENNSTIFDTQQNVIYWHIDWYFVNAENLKLSDSKVSENQKLSSVINKYLSTQDDNLKSKLSFYQAAGFSGIKVLLRAEKKGGNKFYEVDLSDNLKECLKNKIIIEYPIFYVVLADHKYGFDIIHSECGDSSDHEGEKFINAIIKHDEIDSYDKSLNLLGLQSEEEL